MAVFKKAYQIFRERGYRVRLLAAAYRNHLHWSELIGGDVVLSPPCKWQKRFNGSDVTVANRIDTPVDPKIVGELRKKFPDFERAYTEHGLSAGGVRYLRPHPPHPAPVHRSLPRDVRAGAGTDDPESG